MSRYIDADALIKRIQDEHKFGSLMLSNMIAEMPTADVVEVKHGEWIVVSDNIGDFQKAGYRWIKCNKCTNQVKIRLDSPLYDFCPYCGADMRGEKDEQIH